MLLSTNVGISWSTFPKAGASEAEQLSAQQDVCALVTSEMDTITNGILRAFVDTEEEFGPDYLITILPNRWARFRFPSNILQIVGARWTYAGASNPPDWNDIPASQITTEHSITTPSGTIVPVGATNPNALLIAPGNVNWSNGRKGFRVQATAICGFPVAGIDQNAASGATSIHVDDITGWWNGTAGARGTIFDPPRREQVTVAGATPDTTGAMSGPGTLALSGPLKFAHDPAIGNAQMPDQKILVSTMPQSLIMAGFYLATHYGLIRGSTAAIMQSARGAVVSNQQSAQSWYDMAEKVISRYARVL